MAIYFIVKDNEVINVIALENTNEYTPPSGCVLMERVNDTGWLGSYWTGTKFIDPRPFPSWTLANDEWVPPVPKPDGEGEYVWDEANQTWLLSS